MWNNLTQHAQKAMWAADAEAKRLGDSYVSTEHLLLGLLANEENQASRLLVERGVSLEALRAEIERRRLPGDSNLDELALTPRAKRVLKLAQQAAETSGHRFIGADHLLLGLLRERSGLAARTLNAMGVTEAEIASAFACPDAAALPEAQADAAERSAEIDGLLKILQREGRRHNPANTPGVAYFALLTVGPIVVLALALLNSGFFDKSLQWRDALNILGVGGLLSYFVFHLTYSQGTRKQKEAGRRLARIADKRQTPWLVVFLTWQDAAVKRETRKALTRLLPQLRTSDANLLTADYRALLCRMLTITNVYRDADFVAAIVQAMERVGDRQNGVALQRLAKATGQTEVQIRIQTLAQTAFAGLTARLDAQEQQQVLLRASGASAATSETLLRPAANTTTAASELLRPNAPDTAAS